VRLVRGVVVDLGEEGEFVALWKLAVARQRSGQQLLQRIVWPAPSAPPLLATDVSARLLIRSFSFEKSGTSRS
jgi:hypothetical protein